MSSANTQYPKHPRTTYRVGAISYFNTRPLIYQLDQHRQVELTRVVPAELARAINSQAVHTGLVPSIDYQIAGADWLILPVAAIASFGSVLTIRIFSQIPLERIRSLACDPDSHTSVVLAQILWRLQFQRRVQIVPLPSDIRSAEAVLLIGDKVLAQLDYWAYQLDLGEAWTEFTDLPFVCAFWAVKNEGKNHWDELVAILQGAYRSGIDHLKEIVSRYAEEHGFDKSLAYQYLTQNIKFAFGPAQQQGLEKFYELAYQFELIPTLRPLQLYPYAEISVSSSE